MQTYQYSKCFVNPVLNNSGLFLNPHKKSKFQINLQNIVSFQNNEKWISMYIKMHKAKKKCVSDDPTNSSFFRLKSFFIEWSKSDHFERSYEVLTTKFVENQGENGQFSYFWR